MISVDPEENRTRRLSVMERASVVSHHFKDALTGSSIVLTHPVMEGTMVVNHRPVTKKKAIFFPGCSYINYGLPLVSEIYQILREAHVVDGISLLCCGKILSYEENGQEMRDRFDVQLREHFQKAGVETVITACPNCSEALRQALWIDGEPPSIEILALPQVLADMGYKIDPKTAAKVVLGDPEADLILCTHDSCPDRRWGQFADGMRAMLPDDLYRDPAHCRNHSICCGSLPRAAGKFATADWCANTCGEEAVEVEAQGIVTACMSCAFQLSLAQSHLPAFSLYELLFGWGVDWSEEEGWMKVRFLIDEHLGVQKTKSHRVYMGLMETEVDPDIDLPEGPVYNTPTVADRVVVDAPLMKELELEGMTHEQVTATDVGFSNEDVMVVMEEDNEIIAPEETSGLVDSE